MPRPRVPPQVPAFALEGDIVAAPTCKVPDLRTVRLLAGQPSQGSEHGPARHPDLPGSPDDRRAAGTDPGSPRPGELPPTGGRRRQPRRHRCGRPGFPVVRRPGPAPRARRQGRTRYGVPGRLRVGRAARLRRRRPDGRRRLAPTRVRHRTGRRSRGRRCRDRIALHPRRPDRELALAPPPHLPRRKRLRASPAGSSGPRRHRGLPCLPARGARRDRAGRHRSIRLLLPDRDHLARLRSGPADRRGPDHVRRTSRGRLEDDRVHRGRSALAGLHLALPGPTLRCAVRRTQPSRESVGVTAAIDSLLTSLGPLSVLIVMAVVFVETGLLAGFFLPGDSLLFTAGLLVAHGVIGMPIWMVIVAASVAAFAGDQLGYLIGRRLGPRLLSRPQSRLLNPAHLERASGFFDRHGPRAVILARFVPVARTFTPPAAGAARMPYRQFVIYNAIGAVAWCTSMLGAGYLFGGIPFVNAHIELITLGIVLLSLAPAGVAVLRSRLRTNPRLALWLVSASAVACALATVALADAAVERDGVAAHDSSIADTVILHRSDTVTPLAQAASWVGGEVSIALLSLAVIV